MKRKFGIILVAGLMIGWPRVPRARALEPGQKLDVELTGISTDCYQGTYGATSVSSSSGPLLAEGETGQSYLAYGNLDERDGFALRDLASNASGNMKADDDPVATRDQLLAKQKPAHYWWAKSRVLPSDVGRVALEVTWEHWSRVGTGVATKVAGDTRRIEMREGERHVLDTTSATQYGSDSCSGGIQIAVTANVAEDQLLQYELISYDLWLEHRDAGGTTTRRHADAIGRQGESVALHVEPMRFHVPNEAFADGVGADAILELAGYVQGRIQKDGSVVVQLSAGRWTGLTRADLPRRGGIGDSGSKIFTMSSGETVRLTLPTPTGKTGQSRTLDPSANDTAYRASNVIWLDNKTFYAGSQDSIILTVNRVH